MTIPNVTYHDRRIWEDSLLPVNQFGAYVPPRHDLSVVDTIVYHYTAADNLIDGDPGEYASGLPAYLRAIQRTYRAQHKYSIGYSFAIDYLGGVWELRGWEYRPAATGGRKTSKDGRINPQMNRRSIAVLCLVDGADPLTDLAVASARTINAEAERRTGRKLHIGPHSEFDWTACCGDGIGAQIVAGVLDPRTPPPPPIEAPPAISVPADLRWNVEVAAQNAGGGRIDRAWDAVFEVVPQLQDVKLLPEYKFVIEHIARNPGGGALDMAWKVIEGAA